MKKLDKGKYHSTYRGYRIYHMPSVRFPYTAKKDKEMFKSSTLSTAKKLIDKKVRYDRSHGKLNIMGTVFD